MSVAIPPLPQYAFMAWYLVQHSMLGTGVLFTFMFYVQADLNGPAV
jgi:hypothetical protein